MVQVHKYCWSKGMQNPNGVPDLSADPALASVPEVPAADADPALASEDVVPWQAAAPAANAGILRRSKSLELVLAAAPSATAAAAPSANAAVSRRSVAAAPQQPLARAGTAIRPRRR